MAGFSFGNRKSKTVVARIYDKTSEVAGNGHDWWHEVSGQSFNPEQPVLRVEFVLERNALREMNLSAPNETLAATDRLWAYGNPGVAHVSLAKCSLVLVPLAGRSRVGPDPTGRPRRLCGTYLTYPPRAQEQRTSADHAGAQRLHLHLGAFTGNDDIDAACDAVKDHLRVYEQRSRRTFCDRTRDKRRKLQ